MKMEKAKQKRSTLRSITTKLITKVETSVLDEQIDIEHLEDLLDELSLKHEELTQIDEKIQNAISKLEEIDNEVLECDEYATNILKAKRKVKRAIEKCKQSVSTPTSNDDIEGAKYMKKRAVDSPLIKLPLLTIEKFSGEFCDWQRFWDQFESAIHKNDELSNVEKLNYIKSYLTGDAARAIEGFAITNDNYKSVIDTLTERFGKKQLVINSHLNKLLNLHAVKRSSDVQALRKLLDSCEIQIRNLNVLGINSENYGSLLAPILIKMLPADLMLEVTKECGSDELTVDRILQILKTQVTSRERMLALNANYSSDMFQNQTTDKHWRVNKTVDSKGGKNSFSAASFFNESLKRDRCLFCENEHQLHECKLFSNKSLKEKKDFLFKKGTCFCCLKIGHRVKFCRSNVKCKRCFKRHFSIMCPEIKETQEEKIDVNCKEISQNSDHALSNKSGRQNVLMQTLVVRLINKSNNKHIVIRGLYDSGSQYSYLSSNMIKKIGYVTTGHEKMNHSLFGGIEDVRDHNKYKIHLSNLSGNYCCNFDVYDQDKICAEVPKIKNGPWIREAEKLGIKLSDFKCSDKLENEEIDLLIGADVCGKLLTGNIVELKCGVIAIETRLGWSLIGKTPVEREPGNETISALSLLSTERNLSDLWELDVIGIKDPSEKQTKAELEAEAKTHFNKTVERESDGRYTISLPWVREQSFILNNKSAAEIRLKTTVKKLKETGNLETYENVFREWLNEDIIEEVIDTELERLGSYYLPHRAVIKESSTTKIRPVFDASAKGKNGFSLNDCLEKGPNMIELIPSILNRFRLKKYGLTADIRKAFLQINVNPQDRDYLRFLWWEEGNPEKLKVFRHRRVVFGVSSSPFILAATLEHLITNSPKHLERVAEKLKRSMYVDNCVTSVDSLEELKDFVHKSRELMFLGKFDLRGWVLNETRSEDCEKDISETSFSKITAVTEEVISLLGLKWNTKKDTLSCHIKNVNNTFDGSILINKRLILATANQVIDPQGFLTPVTLMPKILLQECWKLKIGWDAELPKTISEKFVDWACRLKLLTSVEIPRKFPEINENASLHVFCDASSYAYATCIFLRSESEQSAECQLVQARSKIAPIKETSIPRLELLACTIGARLAHSIKADLSLEEIPTFYWSDSGNALYWIKRNENWATFVFNRVKEIRSLSDPEMWHHIAGHLNPADLPSRGCSPESLSKCKWWEGPDWLKKHPDEWPKSEAFPDFNVTNSEKKKTVIGATNIESSIKQIYDRISSYEKLVRVSAWILRFSFNCKPNNTVKKIGNLTLEEINVAEMMLFKTVQKESFEGLKDKRIRTLQPVMDSNGLMKVKTRIFQREDVEDFLYPILLPPDHPLVWKLIKSEHERLNHAGVQFVMNALRERYWIIRSRKTVRKVIQKCVLCKRFDSNTCNTPQASLPEDRIREALVFEIIGVDLTGPLILKGGQKTWIVIFTCAVYRAVHLELVSALSTESFLQAFRRFIARRGRPVTVYSDNGTNFVGSDNLFKTINWVSVLENATVKKIEWKFIPPSSPWWGGWWERLIGILKRILRKILGKSSLNYEDLLTVVCVCENIVNNRPLTYLSEDVKDLKAITPAMFLTEIPETGVPDFDLLDSQSLKKRYIYRQRLRKDLRKRFRVEYLGQLKQSSKYVNEPSSVKVGDLVFVSNNEKRINWPLARILEIFPSHDGHIRLVKLKTAQGVMMRSTKHLIPLELNFTPESDVHVRSSTRRFTKPQRLGL